MIVVLLSRLILLYQQVDGQPFDQDLVFGEAKKYCYLRKYAGEVLEDDTEEADPPTQHFKKKKIMVDKKVYLKDNNLTSSAFSLCLLICYLVMEARLPATERLKLWRLL